MHPLTINGLQARTYASNLAQEAQGLQLRFLEEIVTDFDKQISLDTQSKKYKLAEETSYLRDNLLLAINLHQKNYIFLPLSHKQKEEAHITAILRYDKFKEFLETYQEETTIDFSTYLEKALFHVQNAWNITPLSWKKIYAPETIQKK